jgi:membrane protease YdiL (CAAX protease family)
MVRFRRSNIVLIGGLLVIAIYTFISIAYGNVTWKDLGLDIPHSWLSTIGYAVVGLGVILVYSPIADRLATHWFAKPPTLEVFGSLQQSPGKLIAGLVIAWVLGGFLEEFIARGIILRSVERLLSLWLIRPIAVGVAILVAAVGAGFLHSYQGPRAVAIIAQLSVLFGILFVVSDYDLWTVILCHGLYDTIAFIRFASKQSKYSNLNRDEIDHPAALP